MSKKDKDLIKLIAQLVEVKTTRDGGIKIVLECGAESLDGATALQKLAVAGETSLALAITSFQE